MKDYNEVVKNVFARRDEYNERKLQRRRTAKKVGATVSCFCLAAIISVGVWRGGFLNRTWVLPTIPSHGLSDKNASVFIPAFKIPENSAYESKDMLGLIVYNGKIYMQAEYLDYDSSSYESAKQNFVDEYLGTASGKIDERSSKEEYQKEMASSVTGDVYSVKGYDKNFRICIPEMYEGGNFIAFFENLNDITLSTGKDLYGDRLNLMNNYSNVLYETHDDWNEGKEEYRQLAGVSAEDISAFVDALYESDFEDLSERSKDIYDQNLKQAHIYFKMNDGTTVGIRLFENGYVRYNNMHNRVFVKINNVIFDKIFRAAV